MVSYEVIGVIPISDTGLANGAGHFNGSVEVPWLIINVVQGKRYCLRIISFWLRNSNTVIIEAGGGLTKPLSVQNF
ncbi:hypothetical protein P691DRAFT_847468 [Macrolepiota fuliginosa MF-IS2]|uniref:Plastocyanin-like domain-containing protein n=1 Tax=Macrolepiota fuliginosa MF-IS2 TaxID=1400762 RepID=A0A9P6BWZ0_9AGAR|nr:hypothetical protein P691DRAFT_847468 [Macrolepiota fuliginosa MF-IS2]